MCFFFFNDTATTEIYTLSLHDALPIFLRRRANHGFAISSYIQQTSDEVLRVEAGSLYPALHRMTEAGLLKAQWRMSEAGRRARFYELTAKGRRKLEADEKRWRTVSAAVARILRTA